jgi:dTDP-4-dehydrorhamnose reductase
MTNVMVLGSEGMLGHMLLAALRQVKGWRVEGTQFHNPNAPWYFDAENGVEALGHLDPARETFPYIINCIGLTKANIRENDPASVVRAIALNTTFPLALAEYAQGVNARVVHVSTDGVFAQGTGELTEDQAPDAQDVYGQSKLLGEVKHHAGFLNLRCSLVGPSPRERGGLLEWFLQQPDGAELSGYTNHLWKGVTTLEFVNLCRTIIEEGLFPSLRQEGAVLHWAPNQALSKYDLLCLFREVFAKDVKISPALAPAGIARVLGTNYTGLRRLFPEEHSLRAALQALKAFMETETYHTFSKGRWH